METVSFWLWFQPVEFIVNYLHFYNGRWFQRFCHFLANGRCLPYS